MASSSSSVQKQGYARPRATSSSTYCLYTSRRSDCRYGPCSPPTHRPCALSLHVPQGAHYLPPLTGSELAARPHDQVPTYIRCSIDSWSPTIARPVQFESTNTQKEAPHPHPTGCPAKSGLPAPHSRTLSLSAPGLCLQSCIRAMASCVKDSVGHMHRRACAQLGLWDGPSPAQQQASRFGSAFRTASPHAPQYHFAASVLCIQVVKKRGPCPSHVQVAGRRRRKAHTDLCAGAARLSEPVVHSRRRVTIS